MPNQYSKLTKKNIERKLKRKTNPVTSMAQLAREFGVNTGYTRSAIAWGQHGEAAPVNFRRRVKTLVGQKTYNKIRDSRYVNHAYRS